MTETVSRYEFEDLKRRVADSADRLDEIDRIGTRGVAVLAVQIQNLTGDVAKLEGAVDSHKHEHTLNRRYVIGALAAYLAAIGGLYPYLAALHH